MPGAIASPEQLLAVDQARHIRWARDAQTTEARARHKAQARESLDSLMAVRLERAVMAAIDAAPPLSTHQRERLAQILTAPTP
jgi:hypothetical protein